MHQELQFDLLDLLREDADDLPTCPNHGSVQAEAGCTSCSRLLCWACLECGPRDDRLRCAPCVEKLRIQEERLRRTAFLRMPFFYVAIVVVLAAAMLAAGFGRPDPDSWARVDLGKPWHRQRAGRVFLKKAVTERRRAILTRNWHLYTKQTEWNQLATESYLKAAEYWAGTEVEADLRIAHAVMLSETDRHTQGLTIMDSLDRQITAAHPSYAEYLFHRGNIALAAGEKERAKKDWETILSGSVKGAEPNEPENEGEEGRTDSDPHYRRLRTDCRTRINDDHLVRWILAGFKQHDIVTEVSRDEYGYEQDVIDSATDFRISRDPEPEDPEPLVDPDSKPGPEKKKIPHKLERFE